MATDGDNNDGDSGMVFSQRRQTTINDLLSVDDLVLVFAQLAPADLLNAELVCACWHDVICSSLGDELCWRVQLSCLWGISHKLLCLDPSAQLRWKRLYGCTLRGPRGDSRVFSSTLVTGGVLQQNWELIVG
eukprot:SAG11_NODE_10761_length_807_cov_1.169492_1_plen_131_part_01